MIGLLGPAVCSLATPAIDVGTHVLHPDTANQTIQLFITDALADTQAQGLNLRVQIADGGFEAGGSILGPMINQVDILTGTIFDANNTGQIDNLSLPQIFVQTTTTATGTVGADGLLATFNFDTTGIMSGTYAFMLADTLDGSTNLGGLSVDITNGWIQVHNPEPTTLAILLAGSAFAVWRRPQRAGIT